MKTILGIISLYWTYILLSIPASSYLELPCVCQLILPSHCHCYLHHWTKIQVHWQHSHATNSEIKLAAILKFFSLEPQPAPSALSEASISIQQWREGIQDQICQFKVTKPPKQNPWVCSAAFHPPFTVLLQILRLRKNKNGNNSWEKEEQWDF